MKPETNYICPDCAEPLFVIDGTGIDLMCECRSCHKKFEVCQDGEFIEGAWRDMSVIKEINHDLQNNRTAKN